MALCEVCLYSANRKKVCFQSGTRVQSQKFSHWRIPFLHPKCSFRVYFRILKPSKTLSDNLLTKSQTKTHLISKKNVFLPPISNDGALAHLARAFDWQSRGREFDSHTLHTKNTCKTAGVFLCKNDNGDNL